MTTIEAALAAAAGTAFNIGRAGAAATGQALRSGALRLGYSGTGGAIAGAVGLKGAAGVGFAAAGSWMAGEDMTWSKGIGAATAAILIGPGFEKALGITNATPWGWAAAGKFSIAGAAAGGGGNLMEQGVDLYNGSKFKGEKVLNATLWGLVGGPIGGAALRVFTPSKFLKTTGNSLIEEVFGAPKTVIEGVGTMAQEVANKNKRWAW